jgi:hypothetical protein
VGKPDFVSRFNLLPDDAVEAAKCEALLRDALDLLSNDFTVLTSDEHKLFAKLAGENGGLQNGIEQADRYVQLMMAIQRLFQLASSVDPFERSPIELVNLMGRSMAAGMVQSLIARIAQSLGDENVNVHVIDLSDVDEDFIFPKDYMEDNE